MVLSLVNTDFPGHGDVDALEASYRNTLQPDVLAACSSMDRASATFDAALSGGSLTAEPSRYHGAWLSC